MLFFLPNTETLEAKVKPEGTPTESGEAENPAEGSPANGSLRERGNGGTPEYPDRVLALRAECVLAHS